MDVKSKRFPKICKPLEVYRLYCMAFATSYYDKYIYSKLNWIVVQFFQTEKMPSGVGCKLFDNYNIANSNANFDFKKKCTQCNTGFFYSN